MSTGGWDPHTERERMVQEALARRGIVDGRILAAFRRIPRELFVHPDYLARAYENSALPIGRGQSISQPLIIGVMLQSLAVQEGDRVLEVGTGSGYQAALLACLAAEVVTIERIPDLALSAQQRLRELGLTNVQVVVGDGSLGYSSSAPYHRIIAACAAPAVPAALVDQLVEGGRLVVPVGGRVEQRLAVVTRTATGVSTAYGDGCVFVPLIGQQGWRGVEEEE